MADIMLKNERTGEEKTLEEVLLGIGNGKRKRKVEYYCRECKKTTTHFEFTSYKKSDEIVKRYLNLLIVMMSFVVMSVREYMNIIKLLVGRRKILEGMMSNLEDEIKLLNKSLDTHERLIRQSGEKLLAIQAALDRAIEEIYNVRGHKQSREEIKKELVGGSDE